MLENVAAAIDPGCFSVPHAEDPVIFRAREQAGHLASEHRGRAEVFIDAGEKTDLMVTKQPFAPPQLVVETAERGAAIA